MVRRRMRTFLAVAASYADKPHGDRWIQITGTPWYLLRDCAFRSAGFPVTLVLGLCDRELYEAAQDSPERRTPQEAYDRAYEQAAARTSEVLQGLSSHPLFRDAIAWQSPGVLANCLLAKSVRKFSREVSPESGLLFVEMLPDVTDCWLRDAEGNAYTSEFRLTFARLAAPANE